MQTRDQRVDEYIAKAAEFARPILAHIRELVHKACPEARETIKWSVPHFEHQGILCNMATFKAHCAFGFWRGNQLKIEAHLPNFEQDNVNIQVENNALVISAERHESHVGCKGPSQRILS